MYVSSVFPIWLHISQTNFTEASSIAIWNKNRLVVGTAIIVWATNVSVIILGKLAPLPHPTDVPESHTNVICISYHTGE
jgi:hypothetical protein